MTDIKICGLKEPDHVRAAFAAGARYAGFVFFPPSPRAVSPDRAAALIEAVPRPEAAVGLFVDPDDTMLAAVLERARLGMIQLHGEETPRRVAEIKARFGLPVMKALKIAGPEDLSALPAYEQVADWLLFDAKAPAGARLPGGNGVVFDWTILRDLRPAKPWMLSGGLHAGNVTAALDMLSPQAVDVSSGIEDAPGIKNPVMIAEFINIVKLRGSR